MDEAGPLSFQPVTASPRGCMMVMVQLVLPAVNRFMNRPCYVDRVAYKTHLTKQTLIHIYRTNTHLQALLAVQLLHLSSEHQLGTVHLLQARQVGEMVGLV